jgi:hypothetical protein
MGIHIDLGLNKIFEDHNFNLLRRGLFLIVLKFYFFNFSHPHRKNHFATLPVRYMRETSGLILGQKIVNLFVIVLNRLTGTDKPTHRATVSLNKSHQKKCCDCHLLSLFFYQWPVISCGCFCPIIAGKKRVTFEIHKK